MDRDQSVEVIIHNMEDIKMFIMEIMGANNKLPEIILIDAATAKLMEIYIYTK